MIYLKLAEIIHLSLTQVWLVGSSLAACFYPRRLFHCVVSMSRMHGWRRAVRQPCVGQSSVS